MGKIADWLLYIAVGLLMSAVITENIYVVITAFALVGISGFCYAVGTWYFILAKEQERASLKEQNHHNSLNQDSENHH